MAKINLLRASFSAGELSPRLWGRADLDIFRKGCRQLSNFIVQSTGGVELRQGCEYLAGTLPRFPETVRLIPLIRSNNPSAVLVLPSAGTVLKMVTLDGTVTDGPVAGHVTASNLYQWQFIQEKNNENRVWFFHRDAAPWYVEADTNPVSLSVVTDGDAEKLLNEVRDLLGDMQYPSAGTFFESRFILGGGRGKPQTFVGSRQPDPETGEDRFFDFTIFDQDILVLDSFLSVDFSSSVGSYNPPNRAYRLNSNNTEWVIRLPSGEEETGARSDLIDRVGDRMEIISFTSSQEVLWKVSGTIRNARRWKYGSDDDDIGYRYTLGDVEEENSFAANEPIIVRIKPEPDIRSTHAFEYEIESDVGLQIEWMVPYLDYVVIGCDRRIVLAKDLNPDTPPDRSIHSSIGAARVNPVTTSLGIVYAAAFGKTRIYEALRRRDLTALAEHLTEPGVRELVWQDHPQRRLWALMEDDTLAVLAVEPETNVLAWSRIVLGGGAVKSITNLSAPGDGNVLVAAVQLAGGSGDTVLVKFAKTANFNPNGPLHPDGHRGQIVSSPPLDLFRAATVGPVQPGNPPDGYDGPYRSEVMALRGLPVDMDVYPTTLRMLNAAGAEINVTVEAIPPADRPSSPPSGYPSNPGRIVYPATLSRDERNAWVGPVFYGYPFVGEIYLPQIVTMGGGGSSFGQPKRVTVVHLGLHGSQGGEAAQSPDSKMRDILTGTALFSGEERVQLHAADSATTKSVYIRQRRSRPFSLSYIAAEAQQG